MVFMSSVYPPCDRTTWDPGPWDQEPDRLEWSHNGTPCLVRRNQFGAWCGYAGVRPNHPLYRTPFNDVECMIEVHGGVNYSSSCDGDICHTPSEGDTDDIWWFGFDCSHAFDVSPGLQALCRKLNDGHCDDDFGTYRDLEYVKAETQALADQLNDLG